LVDIGCKTRGLVRFDARSPKQKKYNTEHRTNETAQTIRIEAAVTAGTFYSFRLKEISSATHRVQLGSTARQPSPSHGGEQSERARNREFNTHLHILHELSEHHIVHSHGCRLIFFEKFKELLVRWNNCVLVKLLEAVFVPEVDDDG